MTFNVILCRHRDVSDVGIDQEGAPPPTRFAIRLPLTQRVNNLAVRAAFARPRARLRALTPPASHLRRRWRAWRDWTRRTSCSQRRRARVCGAFGTCTAGEPCAAAARRAAGTPCSPVPLTPAPTPPPRHSALDKLRTLEEGAIVYAFESKGGGYFFHVQQTACVAPAPAPLASAARPSLSACGMQRHGRRRGQVRPAVPGHHSALGQRQLVSGPGQGGGKGAAMRGCHVQHSPPQPASHGLGQCEALRESAGGSPGGGGRAGESAGGEAGTQRYRRPRRAGEVAGAGHLHQDSVEPGRSWPRLRGRCGG